MPKDKGIRLIPAIINAWISVAGRVAVMSPICTGSSNKPIIGFKKYTNKLITNVETMMLKKLNPNTIDNLA